jgi:hypothetical protein
VNTEGSEFVVEPNSGIIIDWGVMDSGEVFESRWNDDPRIDEQVTDEHIGILEEFTVR